MRKNKCCYKKSMSCRKVVVRHLPIIVSDGTVNGRESSGRPRTETLRGDKHFYMNGNGFTLIELLVVVLIIGILAAVALPQYQKAVWKSRAAQLMTAASTVGRDATAYKMASGESPTEFAQLSLDYDLPTKRATAGVCGNMVASTDAQRENDLFQIVLNKNANLYYGINTAFVTGPYKCAGFAYVIEENQMNIEPEKLYCVELGQTANTWTAFTPAGGFCEKIMKGTYVGYNSWRYYKLP